MKIKLFDDQDFASMDLIRISLYQIKSILDEKIEKKKKQESVESFDLFIMMSSVSVTWFNNNLEIIEDLMNYGFDEIDISVEDLKSYNNLKDTTLSIGQELYLKGSKK
jgi:hypothetical protein